MPDPSPPAFISYSRADSEFALRLAQDLKSAGARVWIDQLDINPGELWDDAIENALRTATYMLLILTPSSAGSKNVRNEIAYALDCGKIIIPVIYQDCVVPLQLQRNNRIDFRADYAHGLRLLLGYLQVHHPNQDVLDQAAEDEARRHAAWKAREAQAQRLNEIVAQPQPTPPTEPGATPRDPIGPVIFEQPELAAPPLPPQPQLKDEPWGQQRSVRENEQRLVEEARARAEQLRQEARQRADFLRNQAREGNAWQPAVEASYASAPAPSAPPSYRDMPLARSSSRRLPLIIAGAIAVLILAVVAGTLLGKRNAPEQPPTTSTVPANPTAAALYKRAISTKDWPAAIPPLTQSCDLNFAEACNTLAYRYDNGIGTTTDKSKAFTLYQKGCNGNVFESCEAVADDYRLGNIVPANIDEAKFYYHKACNGGLSSACTALQFWKLE